MRGRVDRRFVRSRTVGSALVGRENLASAGGELPPLYPRAYSAPADPKGLAAGLAQIHILPLVLLLPPILSSFLSYSSSPPLKTILAITFITFTATLCLIGVPAGGVGLALGAVRLPIETTRWIVMQQGLSGDQPGRFLKRSYAVSEVSTIQPSYTSAPNGVTP